MEQRRLKDPPDALDSMQAVAWPEGPPPDWTAATTWLSATRRDELARRLEAMVRFVDGMGSDRIDARRAAEIAGLSVPRIYSMSSAWRRNRSVSSLGVYAVEKPDRAKRIDPEVRRRVAGIIDSALALDVSATLATILRRLTAEGIVMPAPTLRRLVMEARRRLAPGAFGARIVLDSAGMDATLYGMRMRLFAVVDVGTGLILGWIDGTDRSRSQGLAFAVDDALARIPSLDLAGFEVADAGPEIELRLHEDDHDGRAVFGRILAEQGVEAEFSTRSLGGAIVSAVGERLDRVWLGLGSRPDEKSYRNVRKSEMPEYSGELSAAIGTAIERHNQDRRTALRTPGAAPDRARSGKARVMDVLRRLQNVEEALLASPYYASVAAAASSPPA
jgi:hypothetical protein